MEPIADLLARPFEEQLELVEADSRYWDEGLASAILTRAERSAEAAEALALVARSIGERVQSVSVVARSYCLSAELSAVRGDLSSARKALERARHYLRSSPLEAPEQAHLCRSLGVFFRETHRTSEAVALLERAQALFVGHEHRRNRARCMVDLALLFERGKARERAGELLQAAHRLLEQDGELTGALTAHLYLARALVSSSLDPEQAPSWLARAAETATTLGPADRLQVLLLEAKVLERTVHLDEALDRLERASGLLAAGGPCAGALLLERARLLWRLGRRGECARLASELAGLPAHARDVVEFALEFISSHETNPSGLIKRATHFLGESRSHGDARFTPVEHPRVTLPWDDIEPEVRASIVRTCKMNPDLVLAEVPHQTLSRLFWTYEALTGVRIEAHGSAGSM